ncbi:MAG: coproporphyrinogen-III oxidase family protein [Verrucomicrobiota bacterium]|jgi:oxygen-independent coproporphyrinogen-3 oxidase
MREASTEPVASLYVHVPFCARKCGYCAFYSEASTGELLNRYVAALRRELELVAADLKPRTVFFGGGTPTLLAPRHWEQIFRAMERLGLLGAGEWTVECNPATISLDKARLLRSAGVNRVSLGVQSLNPTLLQRLGRIHTRTRAFKAFDLLRRAGFDNLNLDLMFAIPGQTLEVWRQTLTEALALGSEHLSSYEVTYEEDTPLYAQLHAGQFVVDEDLACAMHAELVERAAAAGLQQYEIANFARPTPRPRFPTAESPARPLPAGQPGGARREKPPPGEVRTPAVFDLSSELPFFACRHNLNYWRGGSFYGVGPSATSYVRGVRTRNWSNTRLYCELLEQGRRPLESREELAPLARAGETAAFGLRLVAGWPFEQFRQTTGHDLRGEWAGDMNRLVQQGWGRLAPDRFQLTREGLRFADAAARLFLR